ncbi:hypothetical protein [Kingella kingae]|nr:hypothetical protein [Kingella kingae]MDK4537249.1 hypothetical protein [Kingella kingae]MDK4538043.1 hypothetical protein [Kingella kingae]MDK4547256.1 hypothetical protein [Kingella kingae]MDK4577928.1 hypothetical protein [Kingella kingae]MDK4608365.1 hypothetical protein [Kingella kingae]
MKKLFLFFLIAALSSACSQSEQDNYSDDAEARKARYEQRKKAAQEQ